MKIPECFSLQVIKNTKLLKRLKYLKQIYYGLNLENKKILGKCILYTTSLQNSMLLDYCWFNIKFNSVFSINTVVMGSIPMRRI